MFKIIRKKINNLNLSLLLIAIVMAFCIFILNYTYDGTVSDATSLQAPKIVVTWPVENTSLMAEQIFSVSLPEADISDAKMFWGVERGVLEGEMTNKGNNVFEGLVDIGKWDWKKDNKYDVTFSLRDKQNNIIATTSIFVYVGEGMDTNSLTTKATSTVYSQATSVENVAAVYAPLVKNTTPVTPKVSTTSNTFKIDWSLSDIKNNQKFIYKVAGYNSQDISAYWQAEGGHKNIVFNSDPATPFTAAINIFGWRWKEKGPYKITFGITDKNTSAVLASEDIELFWKGEPGNSEIELKSKGVVVASSDVKAATIPPVSTKPESKPETKTETKPVSNAVIKPEANKVVTDQTKSTVLANLTATANKNSYSKSKLFASSKPAVQSALAELKNQADIKAIKYITQQPNSVWLNGDSYEDDVYLQGIIKTAKDKNQIPTFVLYNIPNRDCGSYSSGGTDTIENYKIWIDRVAKNLAQEETIVIVEPDALAQLNCLPEKDRAGRIEMLKYAVEKIAAVSVNTKIYVDAGHPHWVNTDEMSARLQAVGIAKARGFALNVSNFISTSDNITYGNYISNLLGGKKYVIDTSRNGKGPSPTREWCNPTGRALGDSPVLLNGVLGPVDALLWIKFPGESDGQCNGGPNAGGFWTQYAIDLYKNR